MKNKLEEKMIQEIEGPYKMVVRPCYEGGKAMSQESLMGYQDTIVDKHGRAVGAAFYMHIFPTEEVGREAWGDYPLEFDGELVNDTKYTQAYSDWAKLWVLLPEPELPRIWET